MNIIEKWVHSALYLMTTWEVSKMQRYKCASVLHYAYSWHHLWHQSDTLQLRTEQENSVWYFQIPDNTKFLAVQTYSKFSVHLIHYFVQHSLISSKLYNGFASHKANPSSVPQGIVDSYSTLPWVTWEAETVVESILWWGLLWHTLTNGALSTQAKVEGIVPRAAWHWGRESSVINDPLGEPGHTPLYVGLPFAWGSMDGDLMSFPIL